jgi:tripartite-type tricarboxylate transporter receptor subunit TctC
MIAICFFIFCRAVLSALNGIDPQPDAGNWLDYTTQSTEIDTATWLSDTNATLARASGGVGASTHLVGVMLNLVAGTKILHVPFKGSGPALLALLGGHVSMQFGGLSSAAPYIKDGKVRAIAITGEKRDPAAPDVPTFQESGLPGVDVTSVWGLHAPPGTPIEIRRALRATVAEVMRDPETAKQLAERGYQTIAGTPEDHQAQTNALVSQWIEVGKRVNLKE